jgi:hypothetical protein
VYVNATHDGERSLLLAANFSRCVYSQILQNVYVNNVTWWNKAASRYQVLKNAGRRQLQVLQNVYVNVTWWEED